VKNRGNNIALRKRIRNSYLYGQALLRLRLSRRHYHCCRRRRRRRRRQDIVNDIVKNAHTYIHGLYRANDTYSRLCTDHRKCRVSSAIRVYPLFFIVKFAQVWEGNGKRGAIRPLPLRRKSFCFSFIARRAFSWRAINLAFNITLTLNFTNSTKRVMSEHQTMT